MARPFVQLKSENTINVLYKALEKTLPFFKSLEGVIGITLNGGMSRGYADHLSEIDLKFYLETNTYKLWKNGHSPITQFICRVEGFLYDIKVIDMEAEKDRPWNDIDQWDGSYAKILFDPTKELEALLVSKQLKTASMDELEDILSSCWWNYRLAGDIWIHRQDVLQGHMMLNEAVELLVKAVFIANQEFIPHDKWLIHMSRSLEWLPIDWENRLNHAFSTGDLSIGALKNRQSVIEALWHEIDRHCRPHDLPVTLMNKFFYELLKDFIEKESISIDDWKAKAGMGILSIDPFHKFTFIKDGYIMLDKEKWLSISPSDMYDTFYDLIAAVRK